MNAERTKDPSSLPFIVHRFQDLSPERTTLGRHRASDLEGRLVPPTRSRPTPPGASDRGSAGRRIQSASGGRQARTRLPPPDRRLGERGPTARRTCNEGPATARLCHPRLARPGRVAADSLPPPCLAKARPSQPVGPARVLAGPGAADRCLTARGPSHAAPLWGFFGMTFGRNTGRRLSALIPWVSLLSWRTGPTVGIRGTLLP